MRSKVVGRVSPIPLSLLMVVLLFAGCSKSSAPTLRMDSLHRLDATERAELLLVAADSDAAPHCSVVRRPAPSIGELLDSAVVYPALSGLMQSWGSGDRLVLSASADSTGGAEWVRVLESDISDSDTAPVVALIEENLRALERDSDLGSHPVGWTHRLHIERGSDPQVRAGWPVVCSPMMVDPDVLKRLWGAELEANSATLSRSTTTRLATVINLWVGPDGEHERIEVGRSSDYRAFDEMALRVASGAEFEPGEIDGHPAVIVVSLPFQWARGAGSR